MKLLIIICSDAFDVKYCDNIKIMNDYIKSSNIEVEYCGISSHNDFSNYENIISFKYKIINTKFQFSKLCDFITDYKLELQYDWYIKTRPEIKLLENINFDILSDTCINARSRVYNGPSRIKYGMSINGVGAWSKVGDFQYKDTEENIILDDQFFIFHKNIIQNNAFDKIDIIYKTDIKKRYSQNEWFHTKIFNDRKIPLNVIGIYLCFTKCNAFSGDTYR